MGRMKERKRKRKKYGGRRDREVSKRSVGRGIRDEVEERSGRNKRKRKRKQKLVKEEGDVGRREERKISTKKED